MGAPTCATEIIAMKNNSEQGVDPMATTIEQSTDSIIMEVRRLKEENAAEHGFDLRKTAEAARARQREHPERMVTRIPLDADQAHGDQALTRRVSKDEL